MFSMRQSYVIVRMKHPVASLLPEVTFSERNLLYPVLEESWYLVVVVFPVILC